VTTSPTQPLTESEMREMFGLQQDESIERVVDSINLNTAYVERDAAKVRGLIAEIKLRRSQS
jgi:hypothetical protein